MLQMQSRCLSWSKLNLGHCKGMVKIVAMATTVFLDGATASLIQVTASASMVQVGCSTKAELCQRGGHLCGAGWGFPSAQGS